MTHICDHCAQTVDSYWPSGGSDLLCKLCFDHSTREQEYDEDWDAYKARHPYYVGEDLEYNPLLMTKKFLRSVKQECPELLDACKTNIKQLQQQAREEMERIDGYIKLLQGIEREMDTSEIESN
jgi:hypothetical protein